MPDPWDPDRYAEFATERRAPFEDLLALVHPEPRMRIVDLGSGTGELTRILHETLGAAETLGIERSPRMVARSAAFASDELRFVQADVREFTPERRLDLVFSNACLQWIDAHEALFGRLHAMLGPRGQLAVQLPANHEHPPHTVAAAVAGEPPFAAALRGWVRRSPVLHPEQYALLLRRLGFVEQHVRLQIYLHTVAGPEAVADWARGTLLTAYEERLEPATFEAFLARFRQRLLECIASDRPYLYAFRRILIWARRA